MGGGFRYYGQQPMRNETLILRVDELINIAMGTSEKNFIDFKMLQFILCILAGHVSIMEMMVEMRLPKSDALSTLKDEYYEDIKRGGISQKRSDNEKGARAPGGKKGDDKITTGRNKDDKDDIDKEDREGEKKGADGKLDRGSKAGGEVEIDGMGGKDISRGRKGDSKEDDYGGGFIEMDKYERAESPNRKIKGRESEIENEGTGRSRREKDQYYVNDDLEKGGRRGDKSDNYEKDDKGRDKEFDRKYNGSKDIDNDLDEFGRGRKDVDTVEKYDQKATGRNEESREMDQYEKAECPNRIKMGRESEIENEDTGKRIREKDQYYVNDDLEKCGKKGDKGDNYDKDNKDRDKEFDRKYSGSRGMDNDLDEFGRGRKNADTVEKYDQKATGRNEESREMDQYEKAESPNRIKIGRESEIEKEGTRKRRRKKDQYYGNDDLEKGGRRVDVYHDYEKKNEGRGEYGKGKDKEIKTVDSTNIEESTKIDGKGKQKNKDDTIVGNKETRARNLEIDSSGRSQRQSRDESVVQIRRDNVDRSPKNFSDTLDKKAQQSKNFGGSSDDGSFTAQIKQKVVSSKRDNPLGDEYGNVRGDKSGNNKQYDADSAGGGGRDDRSRGGSGRKDGQSGDDRSHRDRGGGGGVGGNSGYGGSGGGGRRDKDDDKERRRKSCDTGRRRKGAKGDKDEDDEEDEEDDGYVDVGHAGKSKEALCAPSKQKRTGRPIDDEYDEDELRKLRERTESFEAGGLWKCMGRLGDRESYEDIEGTLAADSKGNLRFVPTHDKKDKGIIVRDDTGEGKDADERIGRDRGRDDRDYDKDGRGRDDGRGVKIADRRGGRGRDYDRDDKGWDGTGRDDRDDKGRGGRGRDYDKDNEGRGGRGRDYDRDDEGRGGRGRDYDRDDESRGGRGGDFDSDDEGRGGKGRDYDRDDESRGGRGGDFDSDDKGRGGRGRDYDRDDEGRGGRGRDYDRDDESRGGRGGDFDRDDEGRGGRGKDYNRDDEGRGGRGKDYKRDGEGRGGRGREYDRDDESRGGRGRDYDRDDESRGGRGKGSERDRDRDGDSVSRGSGRDGGGGRDRDERGGGGWERDGDGRGSGGRDGRGSDERGGGGVIDDTRYGRDEVKDGRDRTSRRDGEDDRDDEGRRFRGDDYDEKQRGEGARFKKDDDRDEKGGSRGKRGGEEDDDRSFRSDRGGDVGGDDRDRRGDGKGGSEDDEKYSKGRRGDDDSVSGKRGKEGKDRDAESVGSRGPGRGGYDENERGRQVDRDRDGGESGDKGDGRGGKRSMKGRDRDGDSEKGRGKGKGKGTEEERLGKYDEAGKGIEDISAKEGKGGKDGKESDEDGFSGGKGEKRGKVTGGDNEDAKRSGKGKDVYSGESDEEGGIDGKERGKGRVGDTDEIGGTGGKDRKDKGKRKVGDTDEDDGTGSKDGKGKGKRKIYVSDEYGGTGGKDGKGKGKGKLGDIDENGGTGGKDGKGRSKEKDDDLGEADEEDGTGGTDGKVKGKGSNDKGKRRGLGEDSDDEYLDEEKRGKGKGEDVKRDGKRGDKEGKEGDRGGDFERDGKRGGKVGKEGDKDFEDERKGKGDKDAESISSKRGKDAKGNDKDSLSGKGKGKGGEGYDDEDEDDREGRGGAGARVGKPGAAAGRGAADKGAGGGKGKGKESSLTSIVTVASAGRGKGAAGKPGGVGREGSVPRVGSIEVVTQTQFHLLEKAVEELQKRAGPMAAPIMPDNAKLLKDISKGSASLTDVIQALQLQARLQAAERAIDRMSDLIAQLAAAGALTPEMLAKIADIRSEVTGYRDVPLGPGGPAAQARELEKRLAAGTGKKGVTGVGVGTPGAGVGTPGAGVGISGAGAGTPGAYGAKGLPRMVPSFGAVSTGISSMRSGKESVDCITQQELDDALNALREEFERTVLSMTARANTTAEAAAHTAKSVAEKVNVVLQLNNRVTTLENMVDDYTEQLNGFDAGITSQIAGFQQQMDEMQKGLSDGLLQLQDVNNNAETAAMIELTERYDGLVADLDLTLHSHQAMTAHQNQLTDEFKSLMEALEMLREQKADRDEVLDGLRDKADISRLEGLLSDEEFDRVRAELELRMRMCYDKFRAQDQVWLGAVKDFSHVISNKAEMMHLVGIRDDMQEQLHKLNRKCIQLAQQLGDPKTAILARKLAKDGTCAACRIPALMEPTEVRATAPPPMPALRRPQPTGADKDVCLKDVGGRGGGGRVPTTTLPPLSDTEEDVKDVHMCKRWVGGSHTLVTSQVTREAAHAQPAHAVPMRRYMGPGTDGKLYVLAEACIPCEECNTLYTEKIPGEIVDQPGGDAKQVSDITVVTGTEARRVTIISEKDLPTTVKAEEKVEQRPSVTDKGPSGGPVDKRLSLLSHRMSLAEKGSVKRPFEASEKPTVEYKLKGSNQTLTAFEEPIPRRLSDIGVIVKGRVTLVDEEAARRASVRYETSKLGGLPDQPEGPAPGAPEEEKKSEQ